ncbi:SDR family NAD(P)-dependent oxidoreductase [Nocardiopsis lucentensis]|uniref:SDR family NAD(P)-dependent oxidoreductase n=1 Tax=Nocardiopsis lucentensis TaxID=53441 RepID=UPI00034C8DA1|nr:SDR family NAD(P)-dependent oxidoreductase [Nocardiopsis lucentensis]
MNAIDYRRQTVLITGASSGLGAEFARQVAARGAGVVLVARRRDRLEKLAGELAEKYGTDATAVSMDLATPRAGEALERELADRGVEVTSVVNNAGFATYGPFHEEDRERLATEIAVDVTSVVDISRAFIAGLRERGDGFLVNVASMAAYQAAPALAVYGAAKAFVLNFTEALWYESRDTGLRVLALSPGATQTEFFEVAGEGADGGMRRMTAKDVVRTALATLDRRNPPPSVIAGRSNRIASLLTRLVSRRWNTMALGAMMSRSNTAR